MERTKSPTRLIVEAAMMEKPDITSREVIARITDAGETYTSRHAVEVTMSVVRRALVEGKITSSPVTPVVKAIPVKAIPVKAVPVEATPSPPPPPSVRWDAGVELVKALLVGGRRKR
jgi:hypothetical protein